MPFLNSEFFRRFGNCEAIQYAFGPTSDPLNTIAQLDALKFAAEVDRNTLWPIHRIRCFLLSQQK